MENPYVTAARVRAALRALDLRPTREMGQNFLIDADALAAIVDAAELTPDDTALEVGPGLGVLTWELLRRAGRVVAVELDHRLAERLEQEFASEPRLRIIQSDILRLQPEQVIAHVVQSTDSTDNQHGENQSASSISHPFNPLTSSVSHQLNAYKVVANLPYAITSAALRHFLEAAQKPTLMVVLVQWEVAQRIAAQPGDLSVLAHSVQVYAEPEIVRRIPAASFVPVPAVDSAILRLRLRPQPAVDVPVDALLRVIKAGFLQARKKLSNALPMGLAAMGERMEKAQVLAALEAAGIDPGRRAETVTLQEWSQVYRALKPTE